MKSKFVREQKRYTKKELKEILDCSEADMIRMARRLKEYGVLKTVKNTREQRDMTDLAEEDFEISTAEEPGDKSLYIFTFVGIIIIEGRILKCYPKYLSKSSEPAAELKQILQVLQKYNTNKQIIQIYYEGGDASVFNRLGIMLFLLGDYYENGLYTNTRDIIETNGPGEIHWDKTVHNTYPVLVKNKPYYVELQTKKRIQDEGDYFQRLHECVLSVCSMELNEAGLLDLFGMEETKLSDEKPDFFGEDTYIIYRLEKEMNVQFNTRKQAILKALASFISNQGAIDDVYNFGIFGTASFNLVWEKVCAEVMDNQLHTQLGALNLPGNLVVPANASYTAENELIESIGKPIWTGYDACRTEFEKEAHKTLAPDLISIYSEQGEFTFAIFDAKYYTVQLEPEKALMGQPGVGDITKQYLYQLAYREFIEANKISRARNCFLLPTEENAIIEKGSVRIDMLSALGLEKIQIRQLPAARMYDCYLRGLKLNMDELNL